MTIATPPSLDTRTNSYIRCLPPHSRHSLRSRGLQCFKRFQVTRLRAVVRQPRAQPYRKGDAAAIGYQEWYEYGHCFVKQKKLLYNIYCLDIIERRRWTRSNSKHFSPSCAAAA